jgi:hypothetical protein
MLIGEQHKDTGEITCLVRSGNLLETSARRGADYMKLLEKSLENS